MAEETKTAITETAAPVQQPYAQAAAPVVPARIKWMAGCALAILWLVFAVMLFGAVSAFGKTFSAITMIEFVIELFSIHRGVIYERLAQVALSITYLVMMILILKEAIWSTKTIHAVFSKKIAEQTPKRPASAAMFICRYAASALSKSYCFMILACALSGDGLVWGSWLLLVLGILYTVVVAVLSSLPRSEAGKTAKSDWTEFAFALIRHALLIALMCGMAAMIVKSVGSEMSFGLQVLFRGGFDGVGGFFSTFFSLIGQRIVEIIAVFMYMYMLHTVLLAYNVEEGYTAIANKDIKKTAIRMLVVLAVGALFSVCFSSISVSGQFYFDADESLTVWWQLLCRSYLPALLIVAACVVASVYLRPARQAKKS